MLQKAEAGGAFEYAPFIRHDDDENYSAVQALFEGSDEAAGLAKEVPMDAGTLNVFRGNRSLHRVTTVTSSARPRVMALLAYDKQPGMKWSEEVREMQTKGLEVPPS